MRGQQIVVLANNDFAQDFGCGRITSKAHLIRHLCRTNDVLYVESTGMRGVTASRRHVLKIITKLKQFRGGLRQVDSSLWVGTPLIFPSSNRWLAPCNKALAQIWFAWALKQLGWQHIILWNFHPTFHRLLNSMPRTLEIYSCVDDHAAFKGVDAASIRTAEHALAKRADLVLATADALYSRLEVVNPNTHRFPHGVNLEHFRKALIPGDGPAEIAALPHPRVGYIGLLSRDHVDIELLCGIAARLPNWPFVFIGDQYSAEIAPLRRFSNVHLLGPRPFSRLPDYLQGIDICIIPHRLHELNISCNPLKLREYLAAGRPVVATPIPEISRYCPPVLSAADAEGFVSALESAAQPLVLAEREKLSALVAGESWESRFSWLDNEVQRLLTQKLKRRQRVPSATDVVWPERSPLLGVDFSVCSMDETLTQVAEFIARGRPAHIVSINVDNLIKAVHQPEYGAVVRRADIVLADGKPVIWASKLLRTGLREKVSGSDLIIELSSVAAASGFGIFLLGGMGEVANQAADRLRVRFPGLRIVGAISPPCGAWTAAIDRELVSAVRNSGARLLFVALGTPRQELWIDKQLAALGPIVAIGIGAGLDFVAGAQQRAPYWLQAGGLEWLYRLCQNPRRLWRRYLIDDARFIGWVASELAGRWWRWVVFRDRVPTWSKVIDTTLPPHVS